MREDPHSSMSPQGKRALLPILHFSAETAHWAYPGRLLQTSLTQVPEEDGGLCRPFWTGFGPIARPSPMEKSKKLLRCHIFPLQKQKSISRVWLSITTTIRMQCKYPCICPPATEDCVAGLVWDVKNTLPAVPLWANNCNQQAKTEDSALPDQSGTTWKRVFGGSSSLGWGRPRPEENLQLGTSFRF